ncbi:unnamed protein product [Rhizopus stolonifer]
MVHLSRHEHFIRPQAPKIQIDHEQSLQQITVTEDLYDTLTDIKFPIAQRRLDTLMDECLTTHWTAGLRQDSSGHGTSLHFSTEEHLCFAVNPVLNSTLLSFVIPVSSISSTQHNSFTRSALPNSPNLLTSHTSPIRPYSPSRSTSPASFVSSIPSLVSESDKEILLFFGSKDFWKDILRAKSPKFEIDSLVSKYLQLGGDPNVANILNTIKYVKRGYSLVHALIIAREIDGLRLLLQAGADPNLLPFTKNIKDKVAPLVLAVKGSQMDSVRLLVKYGAHLFNSKGSLGENPLHAAVQCDSEEIASYLLQKSQNNLLGISDSFGATPLHYAAREGRVLLIKLFASKCLLRINDQDHKGETPLHYAVRSYRVDVVKALLKMGACPNPQSPKLISTALDMAKQHNHKTIYDYQEETSDKTTKEMSKRGSTITFIDNKKEESNKSNNWSIKKYIKTKTQRLMKRILSAASHT